MTTKKDTTLEVATDHAALDDLEAAWAARGGDRVALDAASAKLSNTRDAYNTFRAAVANRVDPDIDY